MLQRRVTFTRSGIPCSTRGEAVTRRYWEAFTARDREVIVTLTVLALVVLVWVIAAVLVGLLLARVIRYRERQIPMPPDTDSAADGSRTEAGPVTGSSR